MIQYWHKTQAQVPAWLRGCRETTTRAMREGWTFGVGSAMFIQPLPDDAVSLAGDYKCWMNEDGPMPEMLGRQSAWLSTGIAIDIHGREWAAPVVLDAEGRRAFKVAYDRDWRPRLMPEQAALINWAEEATIYLAAVEKAGRIEDPTPGCAWAAHLLEAANHITSETIGVLGLMDDQLMLSTLRIAAGVLRA